MSKQPIHPRLADIIATDTSISSLTETGWIVRGYALADLAGQCCFEEVAHLLVYDALPPRRQLAQFRDTMAEYRRLPVPVVDLLRAIPTDTPIMPALRTTVSMLGHYDPIVSNGHDGMRRRSTWLMTGVSALLAARQRFVTQQPLLDPAPGLSYAGQILHQCAGGATEPAAEELLNAVLIVLVDHALAAPTFAGRVIASADGDLVSACVGLIGAHTGSAEPGITERVMTLLAETREPDELAPRLRAAEDAPAGAPWGQPANAARDPRAAIIDQHLRRCAGPLGMQRVLEQYDALVAALGAQDLQPTADHAAAAAFTMLDLPATLGGPLHVAARTVGCCAHVIEEVIDPVPYRPGARYVGELPRPVPPIQDR